MRLSMSTRGGIPPRFLQVHPLPSLLLEYFSSICDLVALYVLSYEL